MSIMSNYLRKTPQKRHWSAANNSAPSCVIAKNSALMLSTCMQWARTQDYVAFFQAWLS